MTPAFVQSRVYIGFLQRSTVEHRRLAVAEVFNSKRTSLPSGWEFATTTGTEPPPLGSVLIGCVAVTEPDEPDTNLWVHPVDTAAGLLQDRNDLTQPIGRYRLRGVHQDSEVYDITEHGHFNDLQAACLVARELADKPMINGMVQVVDTLDVKVVATYPFDLIRHRGSA